MPVVGMGGYFFRAKEPEQLKTWYREQLGVGGGIGTDADGNSLTAIVATAPATAPASTAKPPQKASASGNPEDVVRSLNNWARAWSSNDVAGYLSSYSPDFQTPKGVSRRAWESPGNSPATGAPSCAPAAASITTPA